MSGVNIVLLKEEWLDMIVWRGFSERRMVTYFGLGELKKRGWLPKPVAPLWSRSQGEVT